MNTPEREADRLPEQTEALLDGWPAPSRSALEWEDLANATVARIRETEVGSTGDDLLAPPLPKEESEGELSSGKPASTPEPMDEPGLLAIAKAAVSPDAGEDAKDIVRAGLRAAEYSRQSHPPAPPTRAAGQRRGTPSSAAGLQGHMPKSSARPVEAVHAAQARSELPASAKREGDKMGPGVIVAGSMLALAAAVALYVGIHTSRGETPVATSHESAQASPAPVSPVEESPLASAAPADKPRMLALDDLKPTESEPAQKEPGKVVVPSATSPMSLALNNQEEKPSATSARSAPAKKAAPPDLGNAQAAPAQGQKAANGLVLKETEEATTEGAAEQPAAAEKQALPSRPSVGAIQGAVGSVMAGARSCLAGQETGSKATVTFGADGHVKSVGVAGPAAGTPAESCVRSALMGARVPPFSEPEYSASFTVRPP
jgi:hypothetical protein